MDPIVGFNEKDARRIASVIRREQFQTQDRSSVQKRIAEAPNNVFVAEITDVDAVFADLVAVKYGWREIQLDYDADADTATMGNCLRSGTVSTNFALDLTPGFAHEVGSVVLLQQRWMASTEMVMGSPVTTPVPYCLIASNPDVFFPVKATVDGGSAGGCAATCDFTYTINNLNGIELDTGLAPVKTRIANVKYATPAANSMAMAVWYGGALVLVEVFAEVPQTETAEVVTGVTCNGDGTITVDSATFTFLKCT
jgi:hypothetical protein